MIKNIIFDFDGVLVDSEVIIAKSLHQYLADMGIDFATEEFSKLAGNKTIEVVSQLSERFNIKDEQSFYEDIMSIAHNLYENKLQPILGVEKFLQNTNHKRLIGSNNIKDRIIKGLTKVDLNNYFTEDSIYTFDLVENPKPKPDIYLKAIYDSKININETIIIEDSVMGVKAGVAAGIMVIGLTAGGHWYEGRSNQELFDAGASEVVDNYEDILLILNNL